MTRFDKIALIAFIAGTIYAAWLLLRPAPIATLLTNLSTVICTPSRLLGRGPEPFVVAVRDLPRWESITPEAVKIKQFPRNLVPPDALSKVEDAVNRVIFVPLTKDDWVLESNLAPKGAGRGLSAQIPPGMRAYTVKVPDVAQGVAGFILPGNHVDVLLSMEEISETNATGVMTITTGVMTTTLLENVEILAVDQKMDAPSDNKVDTKDLRSVTLLVTPQQANQLDLGQNHGMLHLALRNRQDNEAAQTKPATPNDRRPPLSPPQPNPVAGAVETSK